MIDGVEELAYGPISSYTHTFMWGRTGIGKLHVFITPLLDKSACHCAHNAQEEAKKQHDIDANGGTVG